MKRWSAILLFSLVLAPMPASGQASGTTRDEDRPERGPIAILLEQREALALTAEQVTELDAIRQRMEEQNRPVVEQLVQIREKWRRERPANWRELTPKEREAARKRFQGEARAEARPLMATIRGNNREAMRAVRAVLTEEQQRKVRELVRARQGRGSRRP